MKILVSAGEVSGDVHGSYLVRELKKLRPDIYFFGMGGEKLAAEGVNVKFDISQRGTIGIFEAFPNVIPIYLTFLKMKKLLLEEKPALVLLIDSQGFNMPFAKFCKKAGFKTVYYIAPQEWLWGTARGVRKVVETVDLIIAVFEKEYNVYKKAGGNVVYFGHPLLDIIKPSMSKEEARRSFIGYDARIIHRPSSSEGIPKDSSESLRDIIISLCPGSRTQEIRGLLPILLKAGELIQKEIPEARFLIPAASKDLHNTINSLIVNCSLLIDNYKIVARQTYDVLNASDLALCTSGTINLEASLLGIPNLMVYKLSPLTYFVGKHILKISEKLPYFSMPNLLLGEKVIPELVMGDASPKRIAEEALSMLKDKARQEKMRASFACLKAKLGSPGVISRCAKAILSFSSSE